MSPGERIKQRRKDKALTQSGLAQVLGVGTEYVGRWERGVYNPSAEQIIRLAQVLDCTTDWLLGLVDTPDAETESGAGLSPDEKLLLNAYRSGKLPQEVIDFILTVGQTDKAAVIDKRTNETDIS